MWRVWRHDRQLEREFPLLIGDDDGPRPHVEVLGEHGRRIDWGNGGGEEIRTETRERRSDTIHARRVEANFDAIVTWLRAAGICVAFVEYPVDSTGFATANRAMRAVAVRYDLPIVGSNASIKRMPAGRREFLWAMHPNPAMYEEIARDVAEVVLEIEKRCR
jgi:lysophospholipase L1-like esterase